MFLTRKHGTDSTIPLHSSGYRVANTSDLCKCGQAWNSLPFRSKATDCFSFSDMRSPLETEDEAKAFQLSRVPRVSHSSRQRYTGYMRRRLGRGGRVIYDRTAASSEVENFFDQQDTQPSVAEHQSTLILRHAATSSLVPAEDNPLDAKIARRVGINNTNDSSPCEAIARRLQLSFLRKQSSPQLTLSLSRLTGGRRFSSTWHGSSGTRIYSPIPSSTLVNSLSSTPSVPCLMTATGTPVIAKATPTPPFKPVDIGKNKNHHRGVETNLAGVYCQVATSPRSSDGNTLAVGKALLAPSGGSTAAFRAATVSTLSVNVLVCVCCC